MAVDRVMDDIGMAFAVASKKNAKKKLRLTYDSFPTKICDFTFMRVREAMQILVFEEERICVFQKWAFRAKKVRKYHFVPCLII